VRYLLDAKRGTGFSGHLSEASKPRIILIDLLPITKRDYVIQPLFSCGPFKSLIVNLDFPVCAGIFADTSFTINPTEHPPLFLSPPKKLLNGLDT
jgi:hypothetical protein